tara:strand:- start:98 stop:253 length:156 start_codon:yes stop_codon:yes gene_type:complete
MEGYKQGDNKGSSVAKIAQSMYYQLLDEHNELLKKAKKKVIPKIKIRLTIC